MSSREKPIVTFKISVKNFCRFQYFENFDIKFLLLGQHNFQRIASFVKSITVYFKPLLKL